MTRVLAFLIAIAFVFNVKPAFAQFLDTGDFMNFGSGYTSASPIPRQLVYFQSRYAPGTVVIRTGERRLYLVLPGGQALRYGIGVGRDGFRWSGAMYLGSTLYRIHGSNEPETIGQAVSSGCFRMTNDDVVDLYNRVSVGTTVVVKN